MHGAGTGSLGLHHVRSGRPPAEQQRGGNWDVMSDKIGVKAQLCSSLAVGLGKVMEPGHISGSLPAKQNQSVPCLTGCIEDSFRDSMCNILGTSDTHTAPTTPLVLRESRASRKGCAAQSSEDNRAQFSMGLTNLSINLPGATFFFF